MGKPRDASEILAGFDARYRHLRTGSVGYLAAVEDHGDYLEVTPVPVDDLDDGQAVPVGSALALSVGRALGMAGYVPSSGAPMKGSVLKVLREGGRLPMTFLAPGREPDGSLREQRMPQGCLVCDCGPWGCACY